MALKEVCPQIADFSLGPDLESSCHAWFLITSDPLPADTASKLDQRLCDQNQDYDDYRQDGRIQKPYVVAWADRGNFLSLLGREEGGQRKFPRLLSPGEVDLLKSSFK